MYRIRIESAENCSPELEKAIAQSVYLLMRAGAEVLTTNTQGSAIEPNKEYINDVESDELIDEQLKAIKDIDVICDSAGLVVHGEIGMPFPRK